MTTSEQPSFGKRLGMFVFLALPGAGLAAEGGAGLGAAITSQDADLPVLTWIIVGLFLAGSSRLLLLGTQTVSQPLFLLVLLPMPMLLSAGYHLSFGESVWTFPFGFLAVAMPVVMFPLVRLHYRRQAEKARTLETNTDPTVSAVNYEPSTIQ